MKKIFILILLSFSLQSQAQDYHLVLPAGKGYVFSEGPIKKFKIESTGTTQFSGIYPCNLPPITNWGKGYKTADVDISDTTVGNKIFRVVPVINQPRFYNIIRNSNGLLIGMYDANDKSLEFKRDVIRLHEIEELVEQVKRLNTE